MCRKSECKDCGKATWVGCGLHIKAALKGVAVQDLCPNWKKGAVGCAPTTK